MRVAGIDVGSRTIKLVLLKDGALSDFMILDTGHEPLARFKEVLGKCVAEKAVATGYGRHLVKSHFDGAIMTEIKAHSLGAHHLYPKCRMIVDVGGQDSKVIRIDGEGHVENFEMNDRCAAGTGRFLEIMADTLGFSIEDFGNQALKATKAIKISSTCTVFSESEVVSLIAKGENRQNIALGIHRAIASRLSTMVNRVGVQKDIVFSGGVAKNKCIVSLLERELGIKLYVPKEPQIVGAFGAALSAI